MSVFLALLIGALLGAVVGGAVQFDRGVRVGRRTARAALKDPVVRHVAGATHAVTGEVRR